MGCRSLVNSGPKTTSPWSGPKWWERWCWGKELGEDKKKGICDYSGQLTRIRLINPSKTTRRHPSSDVSLWPDPDLPHISISEWPPALWPPSVRSRHTSLSAAVLWKRSWTPSEAVQPSWLHQHPRLQPPPPGNRGANRARSYNT